MEASEGLSSTLRLTSMLRLTPVSSLCKRDRQRHATLDRISSQLEGYQEIVRHITPLETPLVVLTVIRRDREIDVAVGDTRMVIFINEKDGVEFLCPVLRQQPLDNNVTGILALKPAVYEEVQQTPSTKLKIRDQEIDVVRAKAVDYSIVSFPTLDCWRMSAESVLQRHLDDFIVTQL